MQSISYYYYEDKMFSYITMSILFRKLPRNRFISFEAAARTDESILVEHGFKTSDSAIQVQLICR